MNSYWICATLVLSAYLSSGAVYAQSFDDAPAGTSGAQSVNSGQSGMPTTSSSTSTAAKTFGQTNEAKPRAAGAVNAGAGQHASFNTSDYLSGSSSAAHGMNSHPHFSSGAPKETDLSINGAAEKLDYKAPYTTNSFASSINPADKMNDLKPFVQMKKPRNASPAWAREKSQTTHTFQENQEHFGSEDPYGFSSQ
jgi:hypothetical protein